MTNRPFCCTITIVNLNWRYKFTIERQDIMQKFTVRTLTLCALFVALTAVCSQIAIPMAPVPINLATFSAFLSGALLGAKYGAFSQFAYVLLGAVGAPIYTGFTGGPGILFGPTGGYFAGYVAAALVVGLFCQKFGCRARALLPGMVLGMAACYLLGTVWFMALTGTGLAESLLLCVVPFLIGDAHKIARATLVAPQLARRLARSKAV